MSICASGSSTIKPNTPEVLAISMDFATSILPPELVWLRPLLPYIPPVVFDSVSVFCSNDPPGWPTLTPEDAASLVIWKAGGLYVAATAKWDQLLRNILWYQLCQCSSGSTPAITTGPSAPDPLIAINPPSLVGPGLAAPCQTFDETGVVTLSPLFTNLVGVVSSTSPVWVAFPAGATRIEASFVNTMVGGAGATILGTVQTGTTGNTPNASNALNVPANTAVTVTLDIPPAATGLRVFASLLLAAPATVDVEVFVGVYCGTTGTAPAALPGCAPDPYLRGLIEQLVKMVTLIQRQAAPFAYVYGAVHSGLTGNAALTVADLVGVSLLVTTIPASAGHLAGEPDAYYDLGFVTLGTADGYEHSRRIDHEGVLMIPPSAGVFTRIGYSLPPGVVVSITELVREP